MNWDPLQQEVLAALGHPLYAVETAGAEVSQPPDATLQALLRAAGRRPDDGAALEACRALLPAGGLRDAAARRALWPRLRALRAERAR